MGKVKPKNGPVVVLLTDGGTLTDSSSELPPSTSEVPEGGFSGIPGVSPLVETLGEAEVDDWVKPGICKLEKNSFI